MNILIAKWGPGEDLVYDKPTDIRWDDGRPARRQDYRRHCADTHALVQTADGMELRMYPDLVADVRYDGYRRLWFVVPEGGEPISLDLRRVAATNLDIRAALYRLPVVYAVRIHR